MLALFVVTCESAVFTLGCTPSSHAPPTEHVEPLPAGTLDDIITATRGLSGEEPDSTAGVAATITRPTPEVEEPARRPERLASDWPCAVFASGEATCYFPSEAGGTTAQHPEKAAKQPVMDVYNRDGAVACALLGDGSVVELSATGEGCVVSANDHLVRGHASGPYAEYWLDQAQTLWVFERPSGYQGPTSPGRQWLDRVRAVRGYGETTYALRVDGSVWCWRADAGSDAGKVNLSRPTAVRGLTRVEKIAAGGDHACAIDELGRVSCWGSNWAGQLGRGELPPGGATDARAERLVYAAYEQPQLVDLVPLASDIQTIGNTTCVLTRSEEVYCWGQNGVGAAGQPPHPLWGDVVPRPTRVEGLPRVKQLVAWRSFCTLTVDRETWCWGRSPMLPNGSFRPVRLDW